MVARVLQRRFFCTTTERQAWCKSVKQVAKSNFTESLKELKAHINNSDFIAISSTKTGETFSSSAPWTRVLPYLDTPETAYLKTKRAAEKFQILQFMVCPFSLSTPTSTSNPKLVAHPYNFHLFPRDELNIGMPSYSFSCQTSYLTSMARQGFDFNMCIYDGISYLSRVQESAAKHQLGNHVSDVHPVKSSSTPSVSDAIFMERIKSRIRYWRNACKDKSKSTDEALVKSLRKLILGGEVYGSRPCVTIDVCNERQVQLVLETLSDFSDDLVPLIIPDRGGPKAVRLVLTSSEEDKSLLMGELQEIEEEQNKKLRGFREVIDVISASQKPIVAYNCLDEFASIHSTFLASLPPSMDEFMCSLRMVFPQILDVNYLLKEIGPLKKASNIHAAISYLKRQFFVPLDMEIPHQAQEQGGKNYGHNVLYTAYLFAKLSSILKITTDTHKSLNDQQAISTDSYANIFSPCSANVQEPIDEDNIWMNNTMKVSTRDLIFLWGFRSGLSARVLKSLLHGTHDVFSEDFGVQLVDKSCAIVSFRKSNSAEEFLMVMDSGGVGYDALRNLISEGIRAAGYEAYRRVCRSRFWETDLADSLDKTLAELTNDISASDSKNASEVYWSSDSIMVDEL